MNEAGIDGWNTMKACKKAITGIKREDEAISLIGFSKKDLCFLQVLSENLILKEVRQCIRAFCKGSGIVCKEKEGIKKNQLIVQYFGEVYTPTQWYNKQDSIKSIQIQAKKKKLKGQLKHLSKFFDDDSVPEFYNIMLEKHKTDPSGYDVLFIDPTYKGHYGSRFSHSCEPNCGTVPMIANGKYSIGMYAMKDIKYGEELTFDYCSITESEKELKNSKCLCGEYLCKGYYLGYTKKHIHSTSIMLY